MPSIYFAYDLVKRKEFLNNANRFITSEAIFPNDYLLRKNIDAKNKNISLTYGGQLITEKQINLLKSQLPKYQLDTGALEIKQGFAYLNQSKDKEQTDLLKAALVEKENQFELLKNHSDSTADQKKLGSQVYSELKVQYPTVESCIFQEATKNTDSLQVPAWILIIKSAAAIDAKQRQKIAEWIKIRVNNNNINILYEQ